MFSSMPWSCTRKHPSKHQPALLSQHSVPRPRPFVEIHKQRKDAHHLQPSPRAPPTAWTYPAASKAPLHAHPPSPPAMTGSSPCRCASAPASRRSVHQSMPSLVPGIWVSEGAIDSGVRLLWLAPPIREWGWPAV